MSSVAGIRFVHIEGILGRPCPRRSSGDSKTGRSCSGSEQPISPPGALGAHVSVNLSVELFGIKGVRGLISEQFLDGLGSEW